MKTSVQSKLVELNHYIAGQYVAPTNQEYFDSINPATGEVFARVAAGTAEDVDRAARAARHAFESGAWSGKPLRERCAVLRKMGDLILARKIELAQAETQDTGKPINESLEGDVPRAALNFHFFADYAASGGEDCFTSNSMERHIAVHEPVGVIGLITPWNLPLYLATWKLAPCLAMGNSCILKPAEWTPYTATLLGEIASEAGLPPGVFNVVHGFGAGGAGEALTRHPLVSRISFTGETSTGKAIMVAAADTLKKVSFELGGKGANIICADADLEEAIPTAVRAAFRNQGQICLAGSRLFVQRKVYDEVVERMVSAVKNIRVGNPFDPETQMGALISQEHMKKVQDYIELGKQDGRLLTGGERLKELGNGNFLSPAIFTELPNNSRFCQEEIFGPALPIIPFESEQDAIDMTNSTPYGLSASIWSRDIDRCHHLSSKIKSGLVWVNTWFARDLRTPFGGQKASGIGREGGRYSLEFFSELKTISYKFKQPPQ